MGSIKSTWARCGMQEASWRSLSTHMPYSHIERQSKTLAEDFTVSVTLIDYSGKHHHIKGVVGQSLAQCSEMNGLKDILENIGKGGGMAPSQIVHRDDYVQDVYGAGCTSYLSHVIVAKEWYDKIPVPLADEVAQLDHMERFGQNERFPHSRIATEIRLTKDLDGMTVHVPDGPPLNTQ